MADMNVLFVVVDDLRTQLGCYGMPWVQSPVIDRLAAEGVLFERAYCQQAICGPSRCSVLSGCRPDTTGIYDLQTSLREAMPEVLSLPEHFKQQGYETLSIGKVYHHPHDDAQGWSVPQIINTGDWKGRGYLTDEAMEAVLGNDAEVEASGRGRTGLGPAFEAADVPDDAYQDGKDARSAVAELQRLAGADRPFFMALGFHKPHLPFNAPKHHWDRYDPQQLPLAANPFAPFGVTDYTFNDWGELRGYFGMPREGDMPDELARQLIHGYCACVSYMDTQLGLVLDELERLGLREDTVVMLWGDHGWKLGEHNSWCKHSNCENDTQAPLIVSAPDGARGARSRALVEFVDMYPTLADCCGLPVPGHCEGQSFKPLLGEPELAWKSAAFSQYPRWGNVMGYAMRTERWRYVEWQDRDSGAVKARELYDHYVDGQENRNVVDAVDPGIVATLSQQLAAGWQGAVARS